VADWVWVESPGSTLDEVPRIKAAVFGDGYEQRAPDGLNPLAQVHELSFDGVDDAVATDMVNFLRAQKGYLPFNYVPLHETVAQRVICRRWTRSKAGIGESNIRARFEQVFEP